MTENKKVDDILEQWLKDTISWIRAQHGLNTFEFQAENGIFLVERVDI